MNAKLQAEMATLPDAYFGGCPKCGRWDEYLNVGRAHWHVCYKHRTKCWRGENLVSSWRQQSPGDWVKNAATLARLAEVRPAYPAIPPEVALALSRLTFALGHEERQRQAFESDGEFKRALLEDAVLVYDWLERTRKSWIQFVEREGNVEAEAGGANQL